MKRRGRRKHSVRVATRGEHGALLFARLVFLAALLFAWRARAQAPAPPPALGSPGSLTVSPAPDLSPFGGRLLTGVDVVNDDDTWNSVAMPSVHSVHAGDVFSAGTARRALDEVLATGLFARGRVSATVDGAGVKLLVHVVPRKLIESLRLELHGAHVDRDELLRAADLLEGGEIVGRDLPEQKERIVRFLERHGYPSAMVGITTRDTDTPTSVLVLVDVAPGPPLVLGRRFFYVYGTTRESIRSATDDYAVATGSRLDESRLDAADSSLSARLHALGYDRANVSHDVVVHLGVPTLRVRIDAGPRFVVQFQGNDHYDRDALASALSLDTDSDHSPGHLAQKIHDYYIKRGFLDVEVGIETRGRADVPLAAELRGVTLPEVYLVFHVNEHPRVFVASRQYPCLHLDEIRGLSNAPTSPTAIGNEIDSYLEEELPGDDLFRNPDPEGTVLVLEGDSKLPRSNPTVPVDLDPDASFSADTYDRAALHVQELYRNEGFLHAQVGPVELVRRRCDPRSPGACRPVPFSSPLPDACTYDETSVPLPVTPLDPALSCTPDPARGIVCEPRLTVRVPIKLGPRTKLYDLAFTGAHSLEERKLAQAADLVLGLPANVLKLEEARRRILDAYKEDGFAYADVRYSLDESLDHTRARATFAINEGERVIVSRIVIRGNEVTNESVIRRRIALAVGEPYRASLVRKTQERIATLNVFSSIDVSLEDAYVPQARKTVVVTVVEHASQYVEVRPGLSTGEGVRFAFEYGHRNLGGDAIALSLRIQLSYLPDFLILDPQVRQNYDHAFGYPAFDKRLATRSTATLAFPDIGLGPLVRATIDGVFVRDLERDFALTKEAGIVSLFYRPFKQLQFSIAPDIEANDVLIFNAGTVEQYLEEQAQQGQGVNADLAQLLRLPTGPSDAYAQRFLVTWDRRDNSFNAHKGTFVSSGIEHVDWTSLGPPACPTSNRTPYQRLYYGAQGWTALANTPVLLSGQCESSDGHFLRFTETVGAYVPVTKKVTLAAEVRLGFNVQLLNNSTTYTDRLFFMGGIDSMRGWLQYTFMPQDYADQISKTASYAANDPRKVTIANFPLRGGNLMVNPRVELRIPVYSPLETVLFLDTGNLWADASYPFQGNGFPLRAAVGTGLRLQTPIGPIVLDYGINLSRLIDGPSDPRYTYEDFGAFNFAIGLF
jgi:outer membrane protein insertion porin family